MKSLRLFLSDSRARFRDRIIERVRKRRGTISPPYELEYRHIFVLPTTFGSAFALLLIFMALGGLNFNNNMALLMVFTLGALSQMTNLLTYRNMAGLKIEAVRVDPVFAGEPAHFYLHLRNPDDRHRFTLQGALATDKSDDCTDIPALDTGSLSLTVTTKNRGWLEAPPMRLENTYPLGMFRAWSWVFPEARCLVYPRPADDPPPLPRTGAGQLGEPQKGEGDQVHGLRNYRDGDPLKHIAWRTSARHDQLYTREMEIPREESCVLSFDELRGLGTEQRLSVLTAWVVLADHRNLTYRLELPGHNSISGNGHDHRDECLERLALFAR